MPLTAESLDGLSEEWKTEMKQALEIADIVRTNSLIEHIRKQNVQLAEAMHQGKDTPGGSRSSVNALWS